MKLKLSVKQIILLCVSVICNIIGLMTILQINGANMGMPYINKISNMLFQYFIVLTFMPIGIMTFRTFATTLEGKVKHTLALINCIYSTVLTVPLFLSMIICFVILGGTSIPLMDAFVADFALLSPSLGGQIAFYIFVLILSIVFLAEPIIACYLILKDVEPSIPNIINLILKKKTIAEMQQKPAEEASEVIN